MDYGRSLVNWQNKIEGRPYARGGTGCACGIAGVGAVDMVKIAFWPARVGAPVTLALRQEPLPGGLPGQLLLTMMPGVQSAFGGGFGQVIELTTAIGQPLPAGYGMSMVEQALAEIKSSYEYALDEVYYSPGLRQNQTAEERGDWYRSHALNLESVAAEIREQFFPVAAGLAIVKGASDAATVKARMAAAAKQIALVDEKIKFIAATLKGWANEMRAQYELAAQIEAKALVWNQIKDYGRSLLSTVNNVLGWIPAAGAAVKEAAEGVKDFTEDAGAATKAGLGGIAAIVGVGLVALLFIGGRRK